MYCMNKIIMKNLNMHNTENTIDTDLYLKKDFIRWKKKFKGF